ncbi:MAG: hypothetical protein OHK0029_35740 [Armatimonadaceae bacterium]
MAQEISDYLVVGAGLAGLSFAQDVLSAGHTVRLLDKGRGIGGRAATRRMAGTRVDHGAQYFTARSDRFQRWVQAALDEGWLQIWTHGFPAWQNGAITPREPGHPRYAPLNGMNELGKRLSTGLDVQTSVTVTQIRRNDDATCTAIGQDGAEFMGRCLILNLPPVQLLALAKDLLAPEMTAQIEAVRFYPAWALMLLLESDVPGAADSETGWKAVEFQEHPVLGWVSRDHTKRSGDAAPVLVVHGSGPWSEAHLEDPPDTVQAALSTAVQEVFGELPIAEAQVHRWRYALPTQVVEAKHLWDAERRIGTCGDWCGGPRVEGAVESGWSLAEAVS